MRLLLALFLIVLPATLAAQERGRMLAYLGPAGQGRTTMLMIVTPSTVAINPGEDGALVADLTGRTIRVWDARGGRFVDLGQAARMAEAMGGGTMGNTAAFEAAQAQIAAQMQGMLEGIDPNQRAAVQAAIEGAVGIGGGQHAPGTMLSGGAQHRVGMAGALMHDPDLMILEEPTPPYLGHDTVLARILSVEGVPLRDYTLAPAEALPGIEEVLEVLRQLQRLHIEITGGPIPHQALIPDFSVLQPHGFPVTIEDRVQGERWELGRYARVNMRFDGAGMPVWDEE